MTTVPTSSDAGGYRSIACFAGWSSPRMLFLRWTGCLLFPPAEHSNRCQASRYASYLWSFFCGENVRFALTFLIIRIGRMYQIAFCKMYMAKKSTFEEL